MAVAQVTIPPHLPVTIWYRHHPQLNKQGPPIIISEVTLWSHGKDPKYHLLSEEQNPIWKNPQIWVFCTSGGALHAMQSAGPFSTPLIVTYYSTKFNALSNSHKLTSFSTWEKLRKSTLKRLLHAYGECTSC